MDSNEFNSDYLSSSTPEPISDGSAKSKGYSPLWNEWAGLSPEEALQAKIYYSNMAYEENRQPAGVRKLEADYEPQIDPSDIPVFDWQLREALGVGLTDDDYVPPPRRYVEDEDFRGFPADHKALGNCIVIDYEEPGRVRIFLSSSRTLWVCSDYLTIERTNKKALLERKRRYERERQTLALQIARAMR